LKKQLPVCSLFLIMILIISGMAAGATDVPPEYEAVKKAIEQSIGWACASEKRPSGTRPGQR
jgi:hypothetical protein